MSNDQIDDGVLRTFETGAIRDTAQDKLDFEGFLSPAVLERYAQYMHANRKMRDGTMRESDNWQNGIPFAVYMKSLWRHFFELWKNHRAGDSGSGEDIEDAACGILFNTMGYLHEHLTQE